MRPTISWHGDRVSLIDQTRLPDEEAWLELHTPEEVAEAITSMRVRGAPAIGAAGAMGVALAAIRSMADSSEELLGELEDTAAHLVATRPTAVNLAWAVGRAMAAARAAEGGGPGPVRAAVVVEAATIADEDVALNRRLGKAGAALLPDVAEILTHCNAGSLATVGYGTALGIVRAAVEAGKTVRVWVGETRPVLQGSRLTAWELEREGIAVTVVADTAVGALLSRQRIAAVVVGADRVAANGDVANKIGTYTLAVLAARHGVPFYVAAPLSSVDLETPDGTCIRIEERDPEEVRMVRGARVAPEGVDVWNPAFDVTPADLVAAIVTEEGVVRAPFGSGLRALRDRRT